MSSNQHAYTKGKSVEMRLHSLVITVARALHIKEYVLGVFVDISGALNNVKTDAIMDCYNCHYFSLKNCHFL